MTETTLELRGKNSCHLSIPHGMAFELEPREKSEARLESDRKVIASRVPIQVASLSWSV